MRPADANWRALVDLVWEEGRFAGGRILDVGCGTGRLADELARRGGKVWGVDPSAEMLAQARRRTGRRVRLKQTGAEALPFRDRWFDGAVLRLVVHLVDRGRALPELARVLVPGGRVAIVTFAPAYFDRIWLARYFPSLRTIDRQRFPAPEDLARELEDAGFEPTWIRSVSQDATVGREEALEKLRGRYISTLWLLPDDEYAAGVARAERELPAETVYPVEWAIVLGERAV